MYIRGKELPDIDTVAQGVPVATALSVGQVLDPQESKLGRESLTQIFLKRIKQLKWAD